MIAIIMKIMLAITTAIAMTQVEDDQEILKKELRERSRQSTVLCSFMIGKETAEGTGCLLLGAFTLHQLKHTQN